MKIYLTILLTGFLNSSYAQDSLKLNLDSIKNSPRKSDTLIQKINNITSKSDSLVRSPAQFGNKLVSNTKKKLDSLRNRKINVEKVDLDTLNDLKSKIPEAPKLTDYTRATDTLNLNIDKPDINQLKPKQLQTGQSKINEAQGKMDGLNSKAEEAMNKPLGKVNEAMGNLSKEADGEGNLPQNLKVNSNELDIPKKDLNTNLNVPDVKTPDVNSLKNDLKNPINKLTGDISEKKGDITGDINQQKQKLSNELGDIREKSKEKIDDLKPTDKINKLKSSGELRKVKDGQQDILKDIDKTKGYTNDVKEISKGNIDKATTVKSDIMKKASEKTELTDATKDLKMMEEQKKQLLALQKKEDFRKHTMERAKAVVAEQFATQNQKIASSVAKMSEYQSKLGTIHKKIKDLPARRMKEKRPPLIERFIPGITIQVQKGSYWLTDFNPSLRFRARSILSIGAGWNERVAFDKSLRTFSDQRIFGPRSFIEFSVKKGLWVKADVERMNAFVPLTYNQPDQGTRKWVWTYFAGLRKDFSLGPAMRGNVQFMYNIYDPKHISPYLTRFNVRFGFEVPLKKR